MKARLTCLLLALMLLLPACAMAGTATFYRYGDREVPKVAMTIDDWCEPALLPDFMAVAQKYGVKLTLYPSGVNIREQDRELWQAALDAGHEIGSHGYKHEYYTTLNNREIIHEYERFQKKLDKVLGYSYEFLTVRLPYGDGMRQGSKGQISRAIHAAGFDHVIFWDWDDTSDADRAIAHVQNGSIVLMHGTRKDLAFFEKLLEGLKDRGYEYVTVSELLGITSRLLEE